VRTRGSSAVGVREIIFSYPGREPLLRGLDLEIARGEKVGLIGPNGSGKTTLMLLIAGVLEPGSGTVQVEGRSVVPGRFNPDLGFVFQNPDDQLFCPTVLDDLLFGLLNKGISPSRSRAMAMEYLEKTGMLHLEGIPPHHLSGGEKRMVSIAGIMITDPSVVLMDEPESSLDCRWKRKLMGFLSETDKTLLVASHDLEFLLETCGRTVMLDGGKICADGPSAEIMGDVELMRAHGFEKPYSLVSRTEPHGKGFPV